MQSKADQKKPRKMICLSGVSGIGKSSIIKILCEKHDFKLSVSTTTRQPRTGEKHGVHYDFVTKEQFEQRVQQGHFLEYTMYAGHYYGTPINQLNAFLDNHMVFDLDLEISGVLNHDSFKPVLNILLEHEDRQVISKRLLERSKGDINPGLETRLHQISIRVYDHSKYHHVINVTNKTPEQLVDELLVLLK